MSVTIKQTFSDAVAQRIAKAFPHEPMLGTPDPGPKARVMNAQKRWLKQHVKKFEDRQAVAERQHEPLEFTSE